MLPPFPSVQPRSPGMDLPPASGHAGHEPRTGAFRRRFAAIAIIFLAAWFAHAPALRGGFIWDDDAHLTAPALRSTAGLARIWFEPGATQQYYPLLHTVFWVEHHVWRDAPLGYHIANLLLHAAAAVLFAILLEMLAVPGAWLAALIFAVHPVHVETVAWISEQKNTISTLFYLASALAYFRFRLNHRRGWYWIAAGLFVLGLLAKTTVATLPAALLVIIWWQRGKLEWRRDVLPLFPWFCLGAMAGLYTAWFERTLIGAEGPAFDLNFLQRVLLAPRAAWFYFGKLVWPANLTFIYPRWQIDPRQLEAWLPLLAWFAVLAMLGFWHRSRPRGLIAALLIFGGTLFPVLGFFNVYPFLFSFVANHFQYTASLGLMALIAVGLVQIISLRRIKGVALTVSLLSALALSARNQSADYRDVRTLYQNTLARNPDCWMAHNNLGKELMTAKATLPEAVFHFEQAVALRPEYQEAQNNLGLALTQLGRTREAIPHLETAVRLKPGIYQTYNNLGIALAQSGRAVEAVAAFQRAAELNSRLPNIEENWGKALLLLGRKTEAEEHFRKADALRNPGESPRQ